MDPSNRMSTRKRQEVHVVVQRNPKMAAMPQVERETIQFGAEGWRVKEGGFQENYRAGGLSAVS